MYSEHFSFHSVPFQKIINNDGGMILPYHQDVFSLFNEKASEGGIIGLFSAEHAVLDQFCELLRNAHHATIHLNANPKLSADALLYKLAPETARQKQRIVAVDGVIQQWRKQASSKLVIISGAHCLRYSGWKMLAMLIARAQETGLTLTFMLAGDLRAEQKCLNIESLSVQIRLRHRLRSLSAQECQAYIDTHTQTAEGKSNVFPRNRVRKLYRLTQGNITRLNQLAHLSLLAAWAERATRVSARHLRMAAGETLPVRRGKGLATAMLVTVVACAAAGWFAPASWVARLPTHLPVPARWTQTAPPKVQSEAPSIENEIADMPNAMHQLYKVWGYEATADDALCQNAGKVDLSCRQGHATLDALVKENTPWISELNTGSNVSYAVVAHVGPSSLDLLLNNRTWRVTRHWYERHATGNYTLFHHLTPDGKETITTASSAKDIRWLDEALAQALSLPETHATTWTAELVKRTKTYQQRSGIDADGLPGRETLIHLMHTTNMTPVVSLATTSVQGKA